ncbi:ATP-binding protein [Helicobacter sp. MIT 05-5293]|uniref:ATP-binding protein n=1 Tax=Helicobacter sp. MIT 05-5293 TaxID=1548149 RepID=UPI00051D8B9C|nr:ATP-binding protein [Helicobacter sp. MIT 05-5293]TLD80072.1 ATP-binding protein [Helicobacter sp. MIT 05-5293]
MHHYLDFINAKDLEKNAIFGYLKCDVQEGRILQIMAQSLLEGEIDFCVNTLLSKVFPHAKGDLLTQNEVNLSYLPKIRNLIELGWIAQSSFLQHRIGEISLLELYNDNICLTHTFLKLLEDGTLNIDLPEITPYEDHLEYLKDQFAVIDILQKMSALKFAQKINSAALSRASYRLKLLEDTISARLNLTQKDISIISLCKEYALENKEQIIFFALLKEEYSGSDENLRDMNHLLELVSQDEYDKIKHRVLLDENSKLVQKGLVDYDELLSPFGGISRTFFIPENILQMIIHPTKKKKRIKISLDSIIKEQEVFELLEPKYDMSEIILDRQTREILENLLSQMDSNVVRLLKLWGIKDKKRGIDAKILFYGAPGTGKTISALALAKSLKKQILSFDCSKILSMYVGESEKNVRKIFDNYQEICKKIKNEPILLLDEADQFLSTRNTGGHSVDKMHNQMQNIFLEQIERFEGILIATTNLLETFDSAFSRRFNYKIQFKRPHFEQRVELWDKLLPQNAEFKALQRMELAKNLAQYDLSGGQINLVIKNTAYKVATKTKPIFTQEDFIKAIKDELSGNFDGTKSMGFGR